MISGPGAAMLDSKLFVSRLNGDFTDLYERWWDGDEWIWINHGKPSGSAVTGTPGAAMLDEKLFVVVADGSLWERHWRSDLGRWAWNSHGRPGNRPIVHGPGAEMSNEKFFVVTDDGHLWERHWRNDLGRWAWNDHGTPPATTVATAPGAAMMDSKLFVGTANGRLYERVWNGTQWVWVDHGLPVGTSVATAPGAAMMNSKLFVGAADGRLFERVWNGSQWVWVDHGAPPGTTVATAPGAAMMDSKLFVGTGNGHLYERLWNGSRWVWVDHDTPPGTTVNAAPGAAMMDSKLFVSTASGRLYERTWDGTRWTWVNHGTALHDRAEHVVGRPGSDPKLLILIMGDGYAETDMHAYRSQVTSQVLGALRLDQLLLHQDAFRVVRVDLVSVESGVRERRYNSRGTIVSDVFKFSRLGLIPNDSWDRCWFDLSTFTDTRIEKLRERFAPDAEHVIVLVKSDTWGGCSSVGPGTGYFTEGSGMATVAHEMGHNLFALGDEYVNDSAGETFTGVSRYPNTSETPSDWTMLKWFDLVAPTTPLPTNAARPPAGWNRRTSVGAFEGAAGSYTTGLFRPVLECRMNQNNPPWCPVCWRTILSELEVYE